MAISTDEITKIISDTFATPEEFAAIIKILAGVGGRVRLEVQRDALFRKARDAQAALQTRQQERQQDNTTDGQQTDAEIQKLQAEASALQAQIDAINAQLPDLLASGMLR